MYKLLIYLLFFLFTGNIYAQNLTRYLDELPIKTFSDGIQSVVANVNQKGNPITIGGIKYKKGVGLESTSVMAFLLDKKGVRFSAEVGVDDMGNDSIPLRFFVLADRKIIFDSGEMLPGDKFKVVDVSIEGVGRLGLLVLGKGAGYPKNIGAWANASITVNHTDYPKTIPNDGEKYLLTPAPSPMPKINSPKIFGAKPGSPFIYFIAATGEKPMVFKALHLPDGLKLDSLTGHITGSVHKNGIFPVELVAQNSLGVHAQKVVFKISDTISLTPPMGWNGWNSWAREIDQKKVIASSRALLNNRLIDYGWHFINIDDAWQGQRGGEFGGLLANEKFPSFGKMIDTLHQWGLKVGVYSTPWISSYAGFPGGSSNEENGFYSEDVRLNKRNYRFIGKHRFEEQDARQWAKWGVDYLKYDWRIEVSSAERMRNALNKVNRDIIYSISNSAPLNNVKDWVRLTNVFRSGPDIRDSWTSVYLSTFKLAEWTPFGGPGHWIDPDMLVIGNVTTGSPMHPTRLTPDEQYSHFSMHCLLAAPLLIGCPMDQLDAFTLNLLTNTEVIEVNQDPLGKSASLIKLENNYQIWKKPLEDGSFAVGIFNAHPLGNIPHEYFRWGDEQALNISLDLKDLQINGPVSVRDLWRQEDLGPWEGKKSFLIPHHGVYLFKISPLNTK
ncbi:MAG: NPCBM/NEW2 domain-containing protein [Saprospiraceae bacterium]|nr:NPCBM/NEW2 domain-containing protein [Saprospiraceae bacterium]